MDSRLLIVIYGPSGSGKGETKKAIISQRQRLGRAVTTTTRAPRPNEVHGVDYFFLHHDEFRQRLADRKFIESVDRSGNLYGTEFESLDKIWDVGKVPIIDVDQNGVRALHERYPNTLFLFLMARSFNQLRERQILRDEKISEAELEARCQAGLLEILHMAEFARAAFPASTGEVPSLVKRMLLHIDQYLQWGKPF